jgi:hypothetical protein
MVLRSWVTLALLCLSGTASAQMASGRGGPFIEAHLKSLAAFDPALSGNTMVVGGKGIGAAGKYFRLGGAGGGGFAWGAGENVSFGMGYGGVLTELTVTKWLTASMIVGGGGYAISRIVSETETTTTFEKVSSGGFVLFYPGIQAEIKLPGYMTLAATLGYFLPTVSRLQSVTVGLSLLMGKL